MAVEDSKANKNGIFERQKTYILIVEYKLKFEHIKPKSILVAIPDIKAHISNRIGLCFYRLQLCIQE